MAIGVSAVIATAVAFKLYSGHKAKVAMEAAAASTAASTATSDTPPTPDEAPTEPPVYHLPKNAILIAPGPPSYVSIFPDGRVNHGAEVDVKGNGDMPPPYLA